MTGCVGLGCIHITLLLHGMISGTLYPSITWNSYKPHSQAYSDACMFIILSGRSIARQHDEQVAVLWLPAHSALKLKMVPCESLPLQYITIHEVCKVQVMSPREHTHQNDIITVNE